LILFGKILKVRGNKGEVVSTSPAPGVCNLHKGEILPLKSDKYQKQLEIEYTREIKGNPVIKFKEVDTINEALKLVGYSIYIPNHKQADSGEKETLEELEDFLVQDIDGRPWGKVKHGEADALNPLLEVQDENETDIYYVPFTETIVKKIDRQKRLIIIDPPGGLKDLNIK
jgi:16S rRNA processing protein RimM